MTRIEIDYPRAVQLLQEIAGEYPDVYMLAAIGDCAYARMGQPSCIVGHVFSRAGVCAATLAMLDDCPSYMSLDSSSVDELHASGVLDGQDIWLSSPAVKLLQRVQSKQDRGMAWGRAVRESIIEQPAS